MPILRSLVSSILHPALCVPDFPKRSLKGNKNRPAGSSTNVGSKRLSGKNGRIQLKVYESQAFTKEQKEIRHPWTAKTTAFQ